MLSRGKGASSTKQGNSSSKNQGFDLPQGTVVLLGTSRKTRGKLVSREGRLFDEEGQCLVRFITSLGEAERPEPMSISEMAVPLTDWPENFSQASTAGGEILLPQEGTVVISWASHKLRGTIVEGAAPMSTTSDIFYKVDYYKEQNGGAWRRMHNDFYARDLAVPLETWSTPWPCLPAGTIVMFHATSPLEQFQLRDGKPSASGLYSVTSLDRVENCDVPLYDLMVPFTSWRWAKRFQTRGQGYPELPAGIKVILRSRGDQQMGTLQKGPTSHGIYKVDFGVRHVDISLSGMELAVPLETCLHLQQVVVLECEIDHLKEKQRSTSAELEKQKSDCEKAVERIGKITQGKKLILNAVNEHDYSSKFPSPTKLLGKIKYIEQQSFLTWVAEAVGSANETWMVIEGAAEAVESPTSFVRQVLVETVQECYRRIQMSVSSRTKLLRDFVGAADSHLADDIAIFERSAFLKGYKTIFADVCPESLSSDCQTKLALEVLVGLPGCVSVSEKSPDAPKALFDSTQAAYEEIVTSLLMTFLECELSPSAPMKFSDKFACKETWNPVEHSSETFDPSGEGEQLVPEKTPVQVVIPRVFWEKEENGEKKQVFETKASFVILAA